MKMILIAYNEAIDLEVTELLKINNITGFTKWTKVLGSGEASGPHLLTHVWPKGNNVLVSCVEDTQVDGLIDGVRELRSDLGSQGIKAFVLPVEEVT